MTASRDERGKPNERPGDTNGKPGGVTPSTGPAKPGSAGSSAMSPSATPKTEEAPKAAEPAKPGAKGYSGAKPTEAPPAAGSTGSSKPGVSESAKPAQAGATSAASAASATAGEDGSGKDTFAAAGAKGGSSSIPTGAGASNTASGSTSASAASAKSGSSDPAKSSGPTATAGASASPAQPVKSAATGSSAVPPVPPSPASTGAKSEAPVKAAATGSSATGFEPGKDAGKPASGSASPGATRVKPEDALTDGPILDLKANRAADASGMAKAGQDTGGIKSPAPDVATKSGAGFGALAAAGILGGVVGALLLFLLAQTGLLAPKADKARLDALDQRLATLASAGAVAALDKRLAANEAALKPLPDAVKTAQAAASSASEKADQALQKVGSVPAASSADGSAPTQAAPPDLVARLDALDQRVSALQEEPARDQGSDAKLGPVQDDDTVHAADLDVRLKALETKAQAQGAPAVPEEDLAPKLAALQGDLESRAKANEAADKALGQRLDQLQQSLDGRVTAATEAVQQVTQASRQAAEASKVQADEAAKAVDRRLQEQGERIAALDKAMDGSAKAATVQAALRAVAANRISDALVTGAPYADALGSLRGSDAGDGARFEPLAAFADTGAPTAAALAKEFRPIADKIAVARRSARATAVASSGSIGDRLMSMAESVVQVKRVAPGEASTGGAATTATGDDEPEAKVQDALDRGRLAEADKAFAALPEDVRAQAKEFGVKLKAAAEARAAAQELQSEAFKALSAPAVGR